MQIHPFLLYRLLLLVLVLMSSSNSAARRKISSLHSMAHMIHCLQRAHD